MGKRKYATNAERKKARKENSARWYVKNREKALKRIKFYRQQPHAKEAHRQRQLKYAAENREQERLRAAEWRRENPEKHCEMKRDYYLRNAEKVRGQTRAFRLANPEFYREYGRQYKASRRAGGGRLSRGYVKRMMTLQGGLCMACKCDLSVSGHHVDHIIPIAKGGLHCDENVQLLCPTCNRRKSANNFQDFVAQLERERLGVS